MRWAILHGPMMPRRRTISSLIQVMRCVREVRQNSIAHKAGMEIFFAEAPAHRHLNDDSLCVKKWLPGSYSRLKRSLESAITHPTGRGIPILWRLYMSLEVSRFESSYGASAAFVFLCPPRRKR